MKKSSPSGNIRFYVCRLCLKKKKNYFSFLIPGRWNENCLLPIVLIYNVLAFFCFFIINYRVETKLFLKNIFLTILYYHKPDAFLWNTNIRCILKFILLIHKKFKKKYKEFFTIFTANLMKSILFVIDTTPKNATPRRMLVKVYAYEGMVDILINF